MPARTKARKRALDVLYAAEMRGQDPVAALDTAIAEGEGPTNPYTETLVRGVSERRARIDELLGQYAQGWSLDRMPAVDRTARSVHSLLSARRPSRCASSDTSAMARG
jgi:N utilization substance protein B